MHYFFNEDGFICYFLSHIVSDIGRFKSTEGLFSTGIWGLDNPPLHTLVQKAVQACPMDMRKQMWR